MTNDGTDFMQVTNIDYSLAFEKIVNRMHMETPGKMGWHLLSRWKRTVESWFHEQREGSAHPGKSHYGKIKARLLA